MSAYPSLPLFTDAFIADTGHLSAQETGAYLMLMMVAWRSPDCRLADDDDRLARWARVDRRTWLRIKPTIMEFWTLEAGFWSQKRLSKEREFVSKRAEVNRKNGEQGGRPKSLKNNDLPNPAGSVRVSETKAPNPSPNPTEDSPSVPKGTSVPKPSKGTERGSFIATDWEPSDADTAFALAELGSDAATAREREKFRNFWFSKSGADGRKRDWSATWRNWVMRAAENGTGSRTPTLFGSGSTGGRRSPAGNSAVATALARHADRSGIGPGVRPDGPRPGDQGHHRSGRDDSSVEDADWTPAGGYRAAH